MLKEHRVTQQGCVEWNWDLRFGLWVHWICWAFELLVSVQCVTLVKMAPSWKMKGAQTYKWKLFHVIELKFLSTWQWPCRNLPISESWAPGMKAYGGLVLQCHEFPNPSRCRWVASINCKENYPCTRWLSDKVWMLRICELSTLPEIQSQITVVPALAYSLYRLSYGGS
jgi:hypothetical protein